MKKKKIIIFATLISILVTIVALRFVIENRAPINKAISNYIANQCSDLKLCDIFIVSFTDFEWDKVCFVDSGATLNFNPNLIPAELPRSYSLNKPKLIFIAGSNITRFEEVPVGIESTPEGTVLFDIENGCKSRNENLVFEVTKQDGIGGFVYSLALQEKEN